MVKKKEIGLGALSTGSRSPRYKELQERYGLVTKDDVKSLPIDSFDRVREKIQLLHEFALANKEMVDLVSATGFEIVNVLNQYVDLSADLLELEKKLRSEGVSPLLDKDYLSAKKVQVDLLKFIQSNKLNALDVYSKVNQRKVKGAEDSDVLFVNETIGDVE